MKKISILLIMSAFLGLTGCQTLYEVAETVLEESSDPTNTEIIGGLKEALVKGAGFAVSTLSSDGGYLNDPLVKIPFPQEAEFAVKTLRDLGLGNLVDNFVARLNEGAEKGAKEALPIFKNAIREMTVADATNILFGAENAATDYFKSKTSAALYNAYAPKVQTSLDQVNATQLWGDITTRYNSIPLVRNKIETDLVKYTTDRALDGLFLKLADEEKKIREEPLARTSELLKKVFSFYDREKGNQ
ncbi:MAG: DUF4197 domain-containing protein [Bacteroidota bacterium]